MYSNLCSFLFNLNEKCPKWSRNIVHLKAYTMPTISLQISLLIKLNILTMREGVENLMVPQTGSYCCPAMGRRQTVGRIMLYTNNVNKHLIKYMHNMRD